MINRNSPDYHLPPIQTNAAGDIRRVGVEIEFAAPDPRVVGETVARLFSGGLEKQNDHRYQIPNTPFGTFTVELDTQYAHPPEPDLNRENPLDAWLDWEIDKFIHSVVGHVGKKVVPYEIVTPPIPVDQLDALNPLFDGLRELGAEGTDEHPVYAFGLHLNPEVPSLTSESILNHLRAFLVLSDWLHQEMDIDVTRKLSPYIKTFPREYALKVLTSAYTPDKATLIDDYLEDNPTRNRELDLIPLFLFLDRERVEKQLQDSLSSARPTFHYRLPDCKLNDPEWSLAREWNYWVEVERLAADPARLASISKAYLEHHSQWIKWKWINKAQSWLPEQNQKF